MQVAAAARSALLKRPDSSLRQCRLGNATVIRLNHACRVQTLVEQGWERLLRMAGPCNGEPWPRVHAINALRLCIADNGLSLEATAFAAQSEGLLDPLA